MRFNALENQERIKAERAAAFYGKRYFYTTGSGEHHVIGVLQGLGDTYIAGYFRSSGSRASLKVKALWPTRHADDLQQRLDKWAAEKGLREVPHGT